MNFAQEKRTVDEIAHRLRVLDELLERSEKQVADATTALLRTQEAQEVMQHLAQAIQQKAHEKISRVVSSCLAAVFPHDPYEFKIIFERKRGKTEAVLVFRRDESDIDPISASGGGVVDVAAFALRVACLVLHRPQLSRLVVLDEPFKFVSAEYLPNVRMMLEQLSKDMGLQIVMVTHIKELTLGKVIEL